VKKTNPTLLIVDDDPNDLLLMEAAFATLGLDVRVHTASGGQEAIAYLTGEGQYSDRVAYPYPDFMITDLKMPGVDGFTLLERLRQKPKLAVVPTAVFSGSPDDGDIRKSRLLGASSYHVKPNAPAALRLLLKTLHDYWLACEFSEDDDGDSPQETESRHKLGPAMAAASTAERDGYSHWAERT
jgi:CheY-like chemotaxis protein